MDSTTNVIIFDYIEFWHSQPKEHPSFAYQMKFQNKKNDNSWEKFGKSGQSGIEQDPGGVLLSPDDSQACHKES